MSKVTVTESYLSETAEAIRGKLGTDVPYTPAQFAAAIGSIPTGSTAVMVSKTITANGTYDPGDDNADGYDSVVVNVSGGGGPAVPDLPAEYQEVEYVSFDGASYFTCALPSWAVIAVDYEQTALSTGSLVFGYRGSVTRDTDINLGSTGSDQRWYIRSALYLGDTSISNPSGNRFFAKASLGNWSGNIYIGMYWSGSGGNPFNGKLYSFSVLRPTTSAYDLYLVPCYRKADSVIGFYDVINDAFYTNAGSGSFGKGADVA